MASPPLRGALVGCGFFGMLQLEAWRRIPGVEIVAACDPDLDRARSAAPRAYASADALLDAEPLDFVDIATRPDTHLPLVRLAVERRIPAICQKPLAPTWPETLELAAVAAASPVPVFVHENWRWQPWYRRARQAIQDGAIGRPLAYSVRLRQRDGLGDAPYPRQPYFRDMPRLLVHETLVHLIDTARFLFGPIASVHARLRRVNPLIQGEDRALLLLSHASAVDGTLDGHRFLDTTPPGPAMGDAWLEGDEASLHVTPTGDLYRDGVLLHRNTILHGYKGDSIRAAQEHYLHCLRTGDPCETSVAAYLPTCAAVEAAYRSHATGRTVTPDDLSAAAH